MPASHYYGKTDSYKVKLCFVPTVFFGDGMKNCQMRRDLHALKVIVLAYDGSFLADEDLWEG